MLPFYGRRRYTHYTVFLRIRSRSIASVKLFALSAQIFASSPMLVFWISCDVSFAISNRDNEISLVMCWAYHVFTLWIRMLSMSGRTSSNYIWKFHSICKFQSIRKFRSICKFLSVSCWVVVFLAIIFNFLTIRYTHRSTQFCHYLRSKLFTRWDALDLVIKYPSQGTQLLFPKYIFLLKVHFFTWETWIFQQRRILVIFTC